jgi:hypothetical protein
MSDADLLVKNLVGSDKDLGLLLERLVAKLGSERAVPVYEDFNSRFKEKYEDLLVSDYFGYRRLKQVSFKNYIVAYHGVELK